MFAQADDLPWLELLKVTSPTLLYREWSAVQHNRGTSGGRAASHVETLLAPPSPDAQLVTLLDRAPAALSWLDGVCGHRVAPLGTDRFGQTGDLPDLYACYPLNIDAIIAAMPGALLPQRS